MRIAFDIRKYDDFGIGTYIRNVLRGIPSFPDRFTWTLLSGTDAPPDGFDLSSAKIEFELIRTHRRTPFQGRLTVRSPVDLFFAPHYVTPDPGSTRFLLTVHDLIHLDPPVLLDEIPALGTPLDRLREALKRRYHRLLARTKFVSLINAADRIITVSQSTADHLELLLPGTAPKITVIPNCVDAVFFTQPSRDARASFQERHPAIDRPYFVYCGNDLYHKNLGYLLVVWKQIISTFTTPPLLVLTGPPRSRAIRSLADHLGIARHIRMADWMTMTDIHLFMTGAEGLIMPSLAEGFGLPVAEAMACGTPVACSDIRPHREITAGHAAFFNPQDLESGKASLARFVSDDMFRKSTVEPARVAAQSYHPSLFIRRMSDLLIALDEELSA